MKPAMTVSLVFLTFNRLDFTKRAVINNIRTAKYPIKEIIFVDNGSTDGTREWLEENFGDKAKLCFNEENRGIAEGYNQLYSLVGDVDLIARPSSDMCMPDGWLRDMASWHRKVKGTGIVSMISKEYFPSLEKRYVGKPVRVGWYTIQPANALGSAVFKKELTQYRLPEYGLYGYDDTIWTEKVRKAGYLNYYIKGIVQDFREEEIEKYPEYVQWKKEQQRELEKKRPDLVKLNSIING